MAEIDKILPNVSQDVKLPSASKIALEQQQQMAEQMKQPSDLQPNEDGSVDVNFGPENLQVGPDQGHFSNLADMLPDDVLDPLGMSFTTIIPITRHPEKIGNDRMYQD